MSAKFQQNLDEHRALFARLESLAEPVERAATLMVEALSAGRKLMLCGNGGSAADSQHLAAEFTGRFIDDRRPLAAMALSTDTSALTCIANDYSFDEVFYRGDGAGDRWGLPGGHFHVRNSKNVVRAAEPPAAQDADIDCSRRRQLPASDAPISAQLNDRTHSGGPYPIGHTVRNGRRALSCLISGSPHDRHERKFQRARVLVVGARC
jgi:phosphoheptose isomerase